MRYADNFQTPEYWELVSDAFQGVRDQIKRTFQEQSTEPGGTWPDPITFVYILPPFWTPAAEYTQRCTLREGHKLFRLLIPTKFERAPELRTATHYCPPIAANLR